MGSMTRKVVIGGTALLLLHAIFSPLLLAQAATPFMTLADGTRVNATQAQYDALVKQPGIVYSLPWETPKLAATQISIPVPADLGPRLPGGGFISGEPAALAAGMNAVGIASTATAAGLVGGSAAAGVITKGTATPAAASPPR
jgi:hypothetical protein